MSHGIVGVQPQGLLVMLDRLLQSACIEQGEAQVEVGIGIVGLQPYGLLVMLYRLLQSACFDKYVTQVV